MPEKNKYDLFLEEISNLEKQIYLFAQRSDDLIEQISSLNKKIFDLEKENSQLKQKLNDFEQQVSTPFHEDDLFGSVSSLNLEERKNLKIKINDLISKIDNHLRS
ncbi:MAG: hypothetical protein Fur0015_07040 [Ignavibacteriales bacterium]